MMKLSIVAAAMALAFTGGAYAQITPSPQGKKAPADTPEKRIDSDYDAALEACKPMKGNSRDVCRAEAKGKRDVARAELKVQQKDTPENRRDLAEAKAKAEYNVAKERCDDQQGDAKRACEKEAKGKRDTAMKEAKAASGSGMAKSSPMTK